MGYSDFANFKLGGMDGYQQTTSDGYVVVSDWVDVHSAPLFNVSVVFVGGSPAGTLKLEQSNQLQWTGGNRAQPLQQGGVGAVDDTKDVPSGNGVNTVAVSGAGTYLLNQQFYSPRWVRVKMTFSAPVNTVFTALMTWKKP